jgi:exoribonuclease R
MVRNRDIKGDNFFYDEENYRYVGKNTGKTYALGDTVMVKVMSADLIKKQLNFNFDDENSEKKTKFVDHKKRRGR